MTRRACVIGAGPNGLSAAIVLAKTGVKVEVFEAEPEPGGAARTLELTLPGFLHDFGSAVHPLAAGSPFFLSLPLGKYGLEWIHSPCPLAHPFDDGTAITLERSLRDAEKELGRDGKAWRWLMQPFAEQWPTLSAEVLQPVHVLTPHLFLLARFGLVAFPPANLLAGALFRDERTKALFAGLAAHSFLSLDEPLSAAFGVLLGAAAHAVGWPIPRGGAKSITSALCGQLAALGGEMRTSARVENLAAMTGYDMTSVRRNAGAVGEDGWSAAVRRVRIAVAEVSLWAGSFQDRLCAEQPDPLESGNVFARGDGSRWRKFGRNFRFGIGYACRAPFRTSLRFGGAAELV